MIILKNCAFVYFVCCLYRLVNAWLLQTQFDPDEHWQSLEPAYCHVFSPKDCALTWEWTGNEPIRSYVSVLPTLLFYKVVYVLQAFLSGARISWLVSKGPLFFHAVFVSAPTDLCVWYLSSGEWWCLFCSLTSWFQGYALARTYSNSLETLLLLVGMVLLQNNRRKLAFFLGGCSVSIRFTALAAWVSLGMRLAFQQQPRTSIRNFGKFMLIPCATFGLLGVIASMAVDYHFYGRWTFCLWNNILFNVVQNKGALYGTHSWHWYLTGGLPAITGSMFVLLVWDFTDLVFFYGKSNKRLEKRQLLWTLIASYTFLHSCSAHKEFRFLLPILPLCCILAGYRMKTVYLVLTSASIDKSDGSIMRNKKPNNKIVLVALVATTVLLNYPHLVYLSTIHQRSPISVNRYIVESLLEDSSSEIAEIHYLMGCHSTPAYSHLHVPGRAVNMWTLDCSPDCRQAQNCESDAFLTDPKSFVQAHYRVLQREVCEDDEPSSCQATTTAKFETPDFMAVFIRDALKIGSGMFDSLGLHEKTRFLHSMVGIRIRLGSRALRAGETDPAIYKEISSGPIEVFFDEMVLFVKKRDAVDVIAGSS